MNQPIIQLLVLAGIAIFLILRLRSVLGTRDGFEAPPQPRPTERSNARRDFEVIEGGPDHDIIDHVEEGSEAAEALAKMKRTEPSFGVAQFLQGARGAYEMILMGFERGEMAQIKPFLSDEVYEAFAGVVEAREKEGLQIEAEFGGVRELSLADAYFDDATNTAEVSVKFIGELSSVVRNKAGEIIEGEEGKVKRQKDIWTFERVMGADDPNWRLVATGE
ncbi:Tim44/TimA family putative adaptor protein [Alisedimentitalea sp. MJ-SS2]|uniref:Tim44/TimA family putative adaptor protein n=1 Tax=Aliisedimentitalea sp. MJ-SS2 TaxID=3049795 RepID=UPI00290ECA92|nr:Tim44/TimA family putative adaptor protein [Alisedimentitalea sp. MJ-SS2]MDU8927959.1 Tim44/TimA family putative adaptor protein [Alisedimentitalea sp. MJ-SS2]